MIKVAFQDMKTGVMVYVEAADLIEFKLQYLGLAALGIQPVGCHSCKKHDNEPLPPTEGPGQLLEGWNPDDFPLTG